ncbi:MAG TPA: hypothetical protein VFI31_21190 [Pirellulales bacterium]|nr:hypothetical protein [Pirellulales bacterium]
MLNAVDIRERLGRQAAFGDVGNDEPPLSHGDELALFGRIRDDDGHIAPALKNCLELDGPSTRRMVERTISLAVPGAESKKFFHQAILRPIPERRASQARTLQTAWRGCSIAPAMKGGDTRRLALIARHLGAEAVENCKLQIEIGALGSRAAGIPAMSLALFHRQREMQNAKCKMQNET